MTIEDALKIEIVSVKERPPVVRAVRLHGAMTMDDADLIEIAMPGVKRSRWDAETRRVWEFAVEGVPATVDTGEMRSKCIIETRTHGAWPTYEVLEYHDFVSRYETVPSQE